MWTLIAAQFRYCRFGLGIAVAVALMIALPVTIWGAAEFPSRIWMLMVLALSLGANILMWSVAQKERWLLLSTVLPLRVEEIALSRLLPPLLVQAAVGVLVTLGMFLTFLIHRQTAVVSILDGQGWVQAGVPISKTLVSFLGFQGFALIVILSIYLQEELALALGPRRWAVAMVSLAVPVVIAASTFKIDLLMGTWRGVVAVHGVAALIAAAVYALFIRRHSYLSGVSPVTGMPRDWSEAASSDC